MTIVEDVSTLLPSSGCDGEHESGYVAAGIAQITTMAKAYTRGHGFTGNIPNADISAVIVTAAVRLLANPRQVPVDLSDRGSIQGMRAAFTGWSTAELSVLNRYRKRAQ